ncbi:hypothetical protein NC653_005033 [Populus alba x Populus x berolinensis]|uniref:Uncharacterized protein n=1 Tax=Populus alba x Populus x berolinensis TaxID=444605 RepID=A0AAD6RBB6_9ROSI|nr:hypothetical protein NC653_005033 [Populus alba x Populus x berolinensis]
MWQLLYLPKPKISVAGVDEKNVRVMSFLNKRRQDFKRGNLSPRYLLSFGSCMVRSPFPFKVALFIAVNSSICSIKLCLDNIVSVLKTTNTKGIKTYFTRKTKIDA